MTHGKYENCAIIIIKISLSEYLIICIIYNISIQMRVFAQFEVLSNASGEQVVDQDRDQEPTAAAGPS